MVLSKTCSLKWCFHEIVDEIVLNLPISITFLALLDN